MILMARISLILLITWQILGKLLQLKNANPFKIAISYFPQIVLVPSTQEEREVLIRDRLVMVLCDQIHDYINSGSFPQPVKQMPEKYTHSLFYYISQ